MNVQTKTPPKSRAELLGEDPPKRTPVSPETGNRPPTRSERMGKKPEVKYRITFATAFLMIGTALFFDGIEMITTWKIIGVILSYFSFIFANLTFWTWFMMIGVPVGFSSPKKLVVGMLTNILELIPGLDAIPLIGMGWTLGIIALIALTRLEDKTGMSLPTSPKGAVPGTIKK